MQRPYRMGLAEAQKVWCQLPLLISQIDKGTKEALMKFKAFCALPFNGSKSESLILEYSD